MATPEQRAEVVKKAQSALEAISKRDAQELSRSDELARDINFSEAVPAFQEIFDTARQLAVRDISRLPIGHLNPVIQTCAKIEALIEKVEGFTLNQNAPADVCKTIVNEVNAAYDDIVAPLVLPLSFTATQATDYAKIEREAKGYLTTMREEAGAFEQFMLDAREDAKRALSAVREQAAEAGVSSTAEIFLSDSKEHGEQAGKWRKATIALCCIAAAATLAFLVAALMYQPPSTAAAIQYIFAKMLVLSVISYAIFWCSRNYRAHKHNETLNMHRANALRTFKAYVEGTDDERVRDAILLQAAQAAFTPRSTSFDSTDSEPKTVNPVVEILGKSLPKHTND